jgi:hypothetical protein
VSRQFDEIFENAQLKFDVLQFQVFFERSFFLICKQTKLSGIVCQRFAEIFENKKSKFDMVQFHSFLKGQPFFLAKYLNKQKEATAKLLGIGFLGP